MKDVRTGTVQIGIPDELLLHYGMRGGHWRALAMYLERGAPLTDELRRYLIDVLNNPKKRRPNNRTAAPDTAFKHFVMAFLALSLKAGGAKAAEDKVAEMFGVNRRTVQRAINDYHGDAMLRAIGNSPMTHLSQEMLRAIGKSPVIAAHTSPEDSDRK